MKQSVVTPQMKVTFRRNYFKERRKYVESITFSSRNENNLTINFPRSYQNDNVTTLWERPSEG